MRKCQNCFCSFFTPRTRSVPQTSFMPTSFPSTFSPSPLGFQSKPSFLNPRPSFQPLAYKPPTYRLETDLNTCQCGHSIFCHKSDDGLNYNKFNKLGFK